MRDAGVCAAAGNPDLRTRGCDRAGLRADAGVGSGFDHHRVRGQVRVTMEGAPDGATWRA